MTENEIIQILKDNKRNGIAFGFMPIEVKEWCSKNDSNLVYYSVNGTWLSGDNRSIFDMNEIVAIPDTYELPIPKVKSGWMEFEIKKHGHFTVFDLDDDDHQISFSFAWHQWSEFLDCSYKHDLGFTAFGGWRYKNDDVWYMSPRVDSYNHNCHCYCNMYKDNEKNIIPSIPVKIRFWRISK